MRNDINYIHVQHLRQRQWELIELKVFQEESMNVHLTMNLT